MVPAGMVKKMYGASVFYDAVIKEVEKEIQNYISTEKPDFFAQPLPISSDLRNLDMNNPVEYEFPFEIGLKPEISLDALTTASTTFNKVKVTDEMVNEEIERLQNHHGKMLDPETVTSDENVLNVNFIETDADGNPVPDGVTKDNSLLVKYFTPSFREQLMGKKKDDSIILQLNNAFEEKEREWILGDLGLNKEEVSSGDKYFKMTITKVGLVERRELNEEFFKEALPGKVIKTEEEFRNALNEEIQKHWDAQSRLHLHDQLYHNLLDTPIQFPDEFLKRWLQRGGEKEMSEEEVEAEFPSFTNQLKWTLISDKIIKENNLEVKPEELRESMKKEILQYFGQMNMDGDTSWIESYVDRMMKEEKQVDASYRRLITEKLFTWAETQVMPQEKEVSVEELTSMQHNHQH
jgi:trigger factor